jgi:eukaryotic-like serine/threonine-protein kinase
VSTAPQERYVPERKLGAGGMGEVWLATDILLNRQVAIKYLRTSHQSEQRDSLLAEARMLASLNHPNICLIYDAVFDPEAGQFYLVMEYLEGQPLSNLIDRPESLPLNASIDMVIGVLRALQYAHSRRVVHKDIKPENVIVQNDETIKLTDFGLASLISQMAEGTGRVAGTPTYISPEQVEGQVIDGRADLYSLGVMFYEMVSGGRLPFENAASAMDLLMAHLYDTPLPLHEVVADIPKVLERVIMRLLAKEPDERYPSAEVVLNILASLQARYKINKPHLRLLDPNAKPLIGQTQELQHLETIWAEVREKERSRLVVVQGEIGIGKRRLVAEFLSQSIVDKNFPAAVGRCDEFGLPYTPFVEILTTIFDAGLVSPGLNTDQAGYLLQQIPSLGNFFPTGQEANAERIKDPQQAQWQFLEAVTTILRQLGPAVLFLEDATFLDEASIALVRFLLRHGQSPLLLIADYRPSENVTSWFNDFRADEIEVITLSPLSLDLTRQYVVNFLDGPISEALLTTIYRRSNGNPFYIEEITRYLVRAGICYQDQSGQWQYNQRKGTHSLPPTLVNLFTRQLQRLSEAGRKALTMAALIGHEFDFAVWLDMLGGETELDPALDALDEGLGLQLLRDGGNDRYIFSPVDLAGVLASGLSSTRLRHLHRKIAEALVQRQAEPLSIGLHYEKAGATTEAATYLAAAAAKAAATNAINEAIDYYSRALALAKTAEWYEALGHLYRQKGLWSEAIKTFQQALALVTSTTHRARVLNGLSLVLWLYDNYTEAYQAVHELLKLEGISEVEYATAQSHLGMISWTMGQLAEAEKWCQQSVESLRSHGDEAGLAGSYNRLGLVYLSEGKLDEANKVFEQALQLRRSLGDYWGQAYCLNNLAKAAIEQGRFEQAEALLVSAQELFDKIESYDGLMVVLTNLGRLKLRKGQVEAALSPLTQARQIALDINKRSAYGLADIQTLLAQRALAQGELEPAKVMATEALKLVEAAGNREYMAMAQLTLAQIQAAAGDLTGSAHQHEQAIRQFEQIGALPGLLRARFSYAQLLVQQGRDEATTSLIPAIRQEAALIGLYI